MVKKGKQHSYSRVPLARFFFQQFTNSLVGAVFLHLTDEILPLFE